MNKRLLFAAAVPVGASVCMPADAAPSPPPPVASGCIATVDPKSYSDTIRVTHQSDSSSEGLVFQVVKRDGSVLGQFFLSVPLNESVTYTISDIFKKSNVPTFTSVTSKLVQVIETDGNSLAHGMQGTYGQPNGDTGRVPLIFTCSLAPAPAPPPPAPPPPAPAPPPPAPAPPPPEP